MRVLLVVTMLMIVVMVILPPAGTDVHLSGRSQADPARQDILASVAMLFTGLRDLLYGIGETAVTASNALWEALPERLKPLVGLMVLCVSALALVGSLTLTSLAGVLRRLTGQE